METGIELIAKEREEQVSKHHMNTGMDVIHNSEGQLIDAAVKLCADDSGGYWASDLLPMDWDRGMWDHMTNKSYKERLIIAGALIAAEIDRLNAVEKGLKL